MKPRKAWPLLAVALLALLGGASVPVSARNMDLVVMVDTSESMFPYFDDLMNYLVQDLLTEKLHRGDTFHLLSFSSTPEVEIALEVNSEEAAQRAFGRILLLHALGRYTDLVTALQFLYKYTKELPETNPKQIVLITDGVHDPPPGSPYQGSAQSIRQALTDAAQVMKQEGWTFHILRVPPAPPQGEGGIPSYLADLAQTLGVQIVPYKASDKENMTGRTTGYPSLTFPGNLGRVGTRFNAPFKVKNWSSEPIIVRLSSIQSDGVEVLEKKASVTVPALAEATLDAPVKLPLSYPRGDQVMRAQLVFEDDLRISPTSGALSFTFTGKGGLPLPRLTFLYVLYILLGLGVIYLLARLFLFMRKKLGEAPAAGMARSRAWQQRATEKTGAAAGPPQVAPVAGHRGARGTPGRKLLPLMAPLPEIPARATRHSASVDATRYSASHVRKRPTVTSITRALPRRQMQQASLPPLIEMRVSLQNHGIGFRNVHRIPDGASRSVGGGLSAYLVFLVPLPAAIAEIRNVGGRYVFTPLRAELFPGLSGPVEDCLGKEIPFVSQKGRELSLYFRPWVSQLEEINRLMRQTRREG